MTGNLNSIPVSPNRTAQILGSPSRWSAALLELIDVQPLHGGKRVLLYGSGRMISQHVKPGLREQRCEFQVPRQAALEVMRLCVEHDLATITTEKRPGLPDEVRIQLRLQGASKVRCQVYRWGEERSPRFDVIYDAVLRLEAQAEGSPLTYEGRYQDYYYPHSRWERLRAAFQDWIDQLDIDPIRVMSILVPMLVLFVVAYYWVRIDPTRTYGFGGGLAQGYVWLHNWILSWFDGRAVWAANNNGALYVVGFVIGVLLPLVIDNMFRVFQRWISDR